MKIAAYYKNRPNDMDKSLLTVIPDAPRIPQAVLTSSYDWSMLEDYRSNNSNNVTFFFSLLMD